MTRRPRASAAARRGFVVALLWTAALPHPGAAQEVRIALADITAARVTPRPARQAPTISLSDAVQMTILRSPDVRQSSEGLRQALGREQEASGAFDFRVHSAPALRIVRQALPPSLWGSLLIGPVPPAASLTERLDQRDGRASLGLGLTRPLRSGSTLSVDLLLTSQQLTYTGAPQDLLSTFFDTSAQFHSSLSAGLSVPLQKGRGTSVEAPERAAGELVAAGRDGVRHTVSGAVLATTLAYLQLAASQERVRLLEASAARQRDLLAATERQVAAGDLPRFELDRARAQAATAASRLGESRAATAQARVALVRSMGVDVSDLGGLPVAIDRIATTGAAEAPADVLLTRAVTLRRDLRRAAEEQAAARLLESGARADLRRRVDLSVSGGIADLYDGARAVGPLAYDSGRGFYRAFTGRWQPFVAASIAVAVPFANNAARGRLVQAQARRLARSVDSSDLERGIREHVVQARGELTEARSALGDWEEAVRSAEQMLSVTLERFNQGEVTLIDTLLTEEELTRDQLQLLDRRLTCANALARLRFESGELVTGRGDADGEQVVFRPDGLVER